MGEARGPAVFGHRWQVVRRLARGGMGVVYVARDLVRGEQVALKVLYDKEHDFRSAGQERFVREANAPMEIGHPGLVRTLDAGVEPDGTRFIVMELLEGQSLRERMRDGLGRRRGLELVLDLLEPLAAAHDKGFVHRDLKPQNALVVRDARGHESVKLLDFGISRRPGVQTVTDFATGMGTPHYAAPEQMQNARAVTAAADVWSTGVLLYRLLTGRLPFEGDAVQMVIRAWEEPHTPITQRVAGIDVRLSALVDRCLAKAPEQRPADAGALRKELAALLADKSLSLPEEGDVEPPGTAASVAQTLPTEGTTQRGEPTTATDPGTTPDAAAAASDKPATASEVSAKPDDAPPESAKAEAVPAPVPAGGDEPKGAEPASAPARPETGLRSLPPPPPAPPPPPPIPPELTPAPPRRKPRTSSAKRWGPLALLAGTLVAAAGVGVYVATRPVEPGRLHSIQLTQATVQAVPAPMVVTASAAPKEPEGGGSEPGDKEPSLDESVSRTVMEEIVLGPANPFDPNADSRARLRARELTSCLPITDAVHARCFLRALGDRARGEFELRNLVAAAILTGDRDRAREAAGRYLREHPRARYAAQIRQIAQAVDDGSVQP